MRALALAGALILPGAAQAACEAGAVSLRGPFGEARFNVAVADDPGERAQGLMNVASMPIGTGMLFVYEAPQHATFWMRNTLIPLDMIFLDETGTVTRVHENAVPLDETTIDGGRDVRAVLEINGGLAGAIGIAEGAVLRHPLLPQDVAAWRCDAAVGADAGTDAGADAGTAGGTAGTGSDAGSEETVLEPAPGTAPDMGDGSGPGEGAGSGDSSEGAVVSE